MAAANFNLILATLHRMHRQFSDLMDRVNADVRKIQAMEQRLGQTKQLQDEALKRILDQRILLDSKQALLESNEKNIERRKKQLNETKTEKEFHSVQEQISAAVAADGVLSDEILEGLDYLDTLKAEGETARNNLKSGEKLLEETKLQAEKNREWAESEIRRIKVDFRKVEATLEGDYLTAYQRIFKIRRFDSLAALHENSCSGCHTSLPLELVARVTSGATPIVCANCGRLLFLPENMQK